MFGCFVKMNRIIWLIVFVIVLSLSIQQSVVNSSSSGAHHSKSVRILLQSKWPQTPIHLEVAEFLSDENQDYYWQYLDELEKHVMADGAKHRSMSQSEQYDLGLRLASQLLRSEWKLSILKFSLALRSYSPKVVAFMNIIEDKRIGEKLSDCTGSFIELSRAIDSNINQYFCANNQQQQKIKQAIQDLIEWKKSSENKVDEPAIYSVDHIYPSSSSSSSDGNSVTVILYADIGSAQFFHYHSLIKSLIEAGKPIRYIIRHYPPTSTSSRVALSGYGVELAIKSTEYKAQDDTRVRGEVIDSAIANLTDDSEQSKPDELAGFIFSKLKANNVELSEKLNDYRSYLMDQEKEIATLKVWQLQEISLQAVTKVLSVQKEKALSVLKDISQNFPTVARSLVKIHVEPELKREIASNQNYFYQNLNLATSDTALFINGLYHDIDSVDVFTLFDTAKSEFNTLSKLHTLMDGQQERIEKLDASWDQQQNMEFQLDIRDAAVIYINDIEKDRMYRNWPSSLHEMLRPTYPGMLRNIRRNMYHLVLVIDPSNMQSFDLLRMAESFYIHKAPVRIGLVFDVPSDRTLTGRQSASVACLEAFNYILQDKSPYDALSFLTDVIAYGTSQRVGNLEPDDIVYHFKSKYKSSQSDLDDIFGPDSSYDTGRQLARDFLTRTALQNGPKALLNGVLLKESHLNAEYFEDAVLTEIMRQSSQLQKAIYKNELTDQDDVLEWLMSKKTVMTRLNRIIFNMDEQQSRTTNKQVLDLTSGQLLASNKSGQAVQYYLSANINDLQVTLMSTLKYINSKKDCNAVTVWLASHFTNEHSRQILLDALNHLKENSRTIRLALIYGEYNQVTRVIESAMSTINSQTVLLNTLIKFCTQLTDHKHWTDLDSLAKLIPDQFHEAFLTRYAQLDSPDAWPFGLHQAVSSRALATLTSEQMSVVLNGKLYQLALNSPDTRFNQDDFGLMERFAQSFWTDRIMAALTDADKTSGTRKCSDLVLRINSVLLAKTQTNKQRHHVSSSNSLSDDHSVLLLEPKHPDQPFIDLTAIFDPLTRGAQKISPILETFYQVFNARVRIYFNAVEKHSDMPLKLFYRFVLDVEPRFDSNTGQLQSPLAYFKAMPRTPLFTVGMSVPENWMVEPVSAVYDLDNIHLAQVSSSVVSAVFELEHLLVEGHCFEQSSGSPPRGLQFTLGTQSNPTKYDTIVMANLGYFQLKAAPGIWLLQLRSGRSSDIYTIASQDGTERMDDGNNNISQVIPVTVSSFRSLVIKIKVNKKPDKQNEELLYDSPDANSQQQGSGRSWFGNWNSGSDSNQATDASSGNGSVDEDSQRINIFSLASGHLYERLLRIMMLSVLKHTETPVKFWFLKNYLSPQFKVVLPELAKRYKFQYELVQYKWPRWLHQQTEKQRIIWGYKILFLDVLFPLDVKKIIFVDADQVVRADLKELRDLDLEGAPYGYTPFCDSRKDMDGFRFWKSGYWATHLHGRKYHISALYVVDLQKFRRIAAGDRLRGQYQGLSQDPNSLSNLDQDLPNNMIHQVAIKSLPQEWLWCETWCDDESKQRAKTIDLCNNPKTKEPKLTSARRIVAEWQDYDNEIKAFLEVIQANKSTSHQHKTDHHHTTHSGKHHEEL